MRNLALECTWLPEDPAETPSTLRANGSIVVDRASLEAGLAFRAIDATATLSATRGPDRPLAIEA